jgi:hypothetical protein
MRNDPPERVESVEAGTTPRAAENHRVISTAAAPALDSTPAVLMQTGVQ